MMKKIAGTAVVLLLSLAGPGQTIRARELFSPEMRNGMAFAAAADLVGDQVWRVPVRMWSSCSGGSCQDSRASLSAMRRLWLRLRPSPRQMRLLEEEEEARKRIEQPHPDATAAGELPESLRYERRGGWYYVIERKTGREVFRIKAEARPGERRFGTMSWLDRWTRRFRGKKKPVSRHPWRLERREDGTNYIYDNVTNEFLGTYKMEPK